MFILCIFLVSQPSFTIRIIKISSHPFTHTSFMFVCASCFHMDMNPEEPSHTMCRAWHVLLSSCAQATDSLNWQHYGPCTIRRYIYSNERKKAWTSEQLHRLCQRTAWPLLTSGSSVKGLEGKGLTASTGGWVERKPTCRAQRERQRGKQVDISILNCTKCWEEIM